MDVQDSYTKLARILRTAPEVLFNLDKQMSALTGQKGVVEAISNENDHRIDSFLASLGLDRDSGAEEIYHILIEHLIHIDQHLYELLDRPDLAKLSNVCGILCDTTYKIYQPPKGLFIKRERAAELLEKYPPKELLNFFGYANSQELIDKEGFASVVSSLRFTQSTEWMHKFFDAAYKELTPDDFEEREVEIKILEEKWLKVADKFLEKKYHNVSHLKEFGVIFIIPLPIDTAGETLRMFTLLLHYLHEVPFYSNLFRRHIHEPDFISKFQSLLRGDVPEGKLPETGKVVWRVVQRYLAKDDPTDFRLLEPHANPEAEHWYRVGDDLRRLSRIMPTSEDKVNIGSWADLDFVGGFFPSFAKASENTGDVLISFDSIDLIMSLVKKGEIKYLYHQQEAIWNKLLSEYVGHERMNQLVEENIVKGFIEF